MSSVARILIVNDNKAMRRIIGNILKQASLGDNIIEADSGQKALIALKKHKFDLIISDLSMPEMSGLDLQKAVKDDADLKHLPFILITSERQKDKAISTGATDFIVKPFTAETVVQKVQKAIETSKALL